MNLFSSHNIHRTFDSQSGVGLDNPLAQQGHALAGIFFGMKDRGTRHVQFTRCLCARLASGFTALLGQCRQTGFVQWFPFGHGPSMEENDFIAEKVLGIRKHTTYVNAL